MLRMRHMMNARETLNHFTSPQMNAFAVYYVTGVTPWNKSWLNPGIGLLIRETEGVDERFDEVFTGAKIREIRERQCRPSVGCNSLGVTEIGIFWTVGVFLSSDALLQDDGILPALSAILHTSP